MPQPTTMFVCPAPGMRIADPETGEYLPVAGAWVPRSGFWLRRLKDDDVFPAGPPAEVSPPEPEDGKPAQNSKSKEE